MSLVAIIGSRRNRLGSGIPASGGGGGTVTSVTLWYNGQDVSTYNGMLLFTGNTYTLTAKDQSGNTLSNGSGTWASTDATNAPVNSSGVASPNVGIAGGSFTFTHAASGKVGSVPFSVLKTPGGIVKQMGAPANTTALMAQISSTLVTDSTYNDGLPAPTGGGGSLYSDGRYVNHFFIDATTPGRQLMGKAGMVHIFPATGNFGNMLTIAAAGAWTRTWGFQLIRFDLPFTMNGTNTGGGTISAALKTGNWHVFSPGGRAGPELTNGSGSTGSIDNDCSLLNGGTPEGGGGSQTLGSLTSEFTAGEVWVSINLYEGRGGNIMSGRWGWFKIGSVPAIPLNGITVEGPMVGGNTPNYALPSPLQYEPTTVNYNQQPPSSDLFATIFDWQLVNGDIYGDPFGVLGPQSTPTLTGISGGTITQGDTASVVTLTGTNFNANCQPVFSNAGIYPQSIVVSSSTTMVVTVAVSPSATTGAGTVAVNNQASQQTTSTQVVMVNAASLTPTLTSATPASETQGATSQNIALVGTNFITGQTAVFSNAGITVNSTTVNSATSITANITVSGGATTGAGTVKVHDATNGDSNTVSFTVNSSAPTPPLTGAVRRYVASAGTSTTTFGQPCNTWTDQINSVVATFHTVAPLWGNDGPNGTDYLFFDGTSCLREASYDAALNGTTVSVVVIGLLTDDGPTSSNFLAFVSSLNPTFTTGYGLLKSGGLLKNFYEYIGPGGNVDGPTADGSYHTFLATTTTAPAQSFYIDNTLAASGTAVYVPNSTDVLVIGDLITDDTKLKGSIAEILIYDHVLNSTERTALTSYVSTVYGI